MRSLVSPRALASITGVVTISIAGSATAGYDISQGPSANTYAGYALDFDETLGPVGFVSRDVRYLYRSQAESPLTSTLANMSNSTP